MGDLRDELKKIFKIEPKAARAKQYVLPHRPANLRDVTVEGMYNYYADNCENKTIRDPRGEYIGFKDDNLAYLGKIQYFDKKVNRWVEGNATMLIRHLKEKTFLADRWRIGDESRARTMTYIMPIIQSPDCIHGNLKEGMRDKETYVMRYKPVYADDEGIKVVLVVNDPRRGKVFSSSFWSNRAWLRKWTERPEKYARPNSKGCQCGNP